MDIKCFTDAVFFDMIEKSFAFREGAQFHCQNRVVVVQIRQCICTVMI